MTVATWTRAAEEELRMAGIEACRLEAHLLAAHAMGRDRSWLLAHPEAEIPEEPARNLLKRRLGREPLAYILGYREFYGRRFAVGPGVLIPRQETEILVEAALGAGSDAGQPLSVLDIGTGSGCIAITLKLEVPRWDVAALDLSADALTIATENADALGADLEMIQSDLFANLAGRSFDLIVTNPPYVGRDDALEPEVRDHEPESALFAPDDALSVYRRLAVESRDHLNRGGRLMAEIGQGQEARVKAIFEHAGWRYLFTRPDLAGIPRVIAFALG